MPYTNVHRMARISPTKARPVVDLIRGRTADEALSVLTLSKRRATVFISSTIYWLNTWLGSRSHI